MSGNALSVSIAFCVAALIPAFGFGAIELIDKSSYFSRSVIQYGFESTATVFLFSFVIALAHAIILGLPAYFIVQKYKINTWRVSLIVGFLIGATPLGIFTFPIDHPGNGFSYGGSSGGKAVNYVLNGITTPEGWIKYFQSLVLWGCLGSVCAFTAWGVWRFLRKHETMIEHGSSK